jgi:hypothetical protein
MIKAKAGGLMTQNLEMINLDEIPAERDSTTFFVVFDPVSAAVVRCFAGPHFLNYKVSPGCFSFESYPV